MDDKIIEVLLEIKNGYGAEIFTDKKRLDAFLKDLLDSKLYKIRTNGTGRQLVE